MNRELQIEIAENLLNTWMKPSVTARIFNVSEKQVLTAVAETNIVERCNKCYWWVKAGTLNDDLICGGCRDE